MVTAMISTIAFGQVQSDIRTATLVHGDKTTVYYGQKALANAYDNAAEKGDVIILSPGVFDDITIKKNISIYGSGYETDTVSGAEPTEGSKFSISPTTSTDVFGEKKDIYPEVLIEGIYISKMWSTYYSNITALYISDSENNGTLDNLIIRKCKIPGKIALNPKSNNCKFIQCVLGNIGSNNSTNTQAPFNSYFKNKQNQLNFENCIMSAHGGSDDSNIVYNHCLIQSVYDKYAHLTNCIIFDYNASWTGNYNIINKIKSGSITGEGNILNLSTDAIFAAENEDGTYEANKDFALRYPDVHVGTDGTEIGINGGLYPFDRIPSTPRILESNIDLETTSDGKLNVSLKVQAQSK